MDSGYSGTIDTVSILKYIMSVYEGGVHNAPSIIDNIIADSISKKKSKIVCIDIDSIDTRMSV